MSKSIGIDLGTTNSVAAIKKVHTEVLKNAEGEFITPSCVTVKKKKLPFSKPVFVVGKHALEWMKQDPENTIVAIKRLMGRSHLNKHVQQIIANRELHYQINRHSKGTEKSLAVILNGKEYTPEEISSKILEKIRIDAAKSQNDEVDYAVITVPAYFNDKQKHATRTAAALAGLKVRRLLPEPTAAAISFGVDNIKGDEGKTVLVFDFGGGTFDLSVLSISGGQFIEQGKGGDMWLGGEDIDRFIADYVLAETGKEYQIDNMKEFIENQAGKQKNLFLGELKTKVEKAKIRLSDEDEAYIEILGILKDSDGDSIDVDVELTRKQFNEIITPVVDTTIRLTRRILEDIHFTPDLIDNVLLVGGSSRIPKVVEAMKQEFGDEKVLVHERPMLAIAEGAAILSHRLADTYECPKCGQTVSQSDKVCKSCEFDLEKYIIEQGVIDIVHSAAHDYYIYLENNEKHLFVEKNTPLPFEKTEVFKLVHPEQKLVHMKFINVVNEADEPIGDLWLGIDIDEEKDEKKKKDALHVAITLKIDENNLIDVTAVLKEYPDIQLSKTLSRGKSDEKLFLSLEKTIAEANQKSYSEYTIIDLLYRSLSIIKNIHTVVDQKTGEVDEPMYKLSAMKIEKAARMAAEGHNSKTSIYYANTALHSFGPAIRSKNQEDIRKKMKRLEEMDEHGTYDENVRALKDFEESVDKLGGVNALMQIQKAGDICMETQPSKAPKFYRCIEDIMEEFKHGNEKKALELLTTIMPEAYIIINKFEAKTGVIYKDIAK
ncbi:MAG: Hsp70 family protein [Desulfobacteraceae bacterium]|nr:Hsp70 family protein [Desulfobacteraceae bacterium]MBC2719828.1 Hsp70 family protein [Desulfobacteraceae bacterium]